MESGSDAMSFFEQVIMGARNLLETAMGDLSTHKLMAPDRHAAHISEIINLHSFDTETELYSSATRCGFILEVVPIIGLEQTGVTQLNRLLHDIDFGHCRLQVLLSVGQQTGGVLDSYVDGRGESEAILRDIAVSRAEALKRASVFALSQSGKDWRARHQRVFLVVSSDDVSKAGIDALLALRARVINIGGQLRTHIKRVMPDALIGFYRSLIAPDIAPADARLESNLSLDEARTHYDALGWSPRDPLYNQITREGEDIAFHDDQVNFVSGTVARSYMADQLPKFAFPGAMNAVLGDPFNDNVFCPYPYLVVLTVMDSDKSKGGLLAKQVRLQQDSGFMGRFSSRPADVHDDLRFAASKLEDGERVFGVIMQAVVYAHEREIETAESALHTVFEYLGFQLRRNKLTSLGPAFMNALPFGAEDANLAFFKDLGLVKHVLTSNVATLMPLYGEWRGNAGATPGLIPLVGRRGQLAPFTPFESATNYNVAVIGQSGSGKSVFLQDLAFNIVGHRGRVVVIDDGKSFKNACEIAGGAHVDCGDVDIQVNPFASLDKDAMAQDPEYKETGISMLASAFSAMCDPDNPPSKFERAELMTVLNEVWEAKQNEGNVDAVVDALKAKAGNDTAGNLARLLAPFTSQGAYGHPLNRGSNISLDNRMTVFELSSLEGKPELKVVVMMLIIFTATQQMHRSARTEPMAIVIDEAWALLAGGGKEFVEGLARRARKYRCALITGTQNLDDYFRNESAEAAFNSSEWLVVLQIKNAAIEKLSASNKIDVTEHLRRALKSLAPVKGLYSELVIVSSVGWDLFRFICDPLSLAIYSSSGEDVSFVEARIAEGASRTDAIKELAARIENAREGEVA